MIPIKNPKPRGPEDEDKEDEGEFIPGVGSGGIGKVKVADFGLSKVVWESQTMTPCGTVGYTAPEIVKDERYSKSVDMWAMGCVLYTLLCGFPPFYDEVIDVLTEKVAKGQYSFLTPWWDDISKSAQDLISHLLTVDPEKRYTINEFMNHPWVKQSSEPTEPADDAPPLATPALYRKSETPMLIDQDFTPGGTTARRMDFRSPGSVAIREVFDVAYAVHRLEEEGKRRKKWKQGYRGAYQLNAMDEEEGEYASGDESAERSKVPRQAGNPAADDVAESLKKTNLTGSHQIHQQQKQTKMEQHRKVESAVQKGRHRKGAFELSLDNATLLGRRKKHGNEHGRGDPVIRGHIHVS